MSVVSVCVAQTPRVAVTGSQEERSWGRGREVHSRKSKRCYSRVVMRIVCVPDGNTEGSRERGGGGGGGGGVRGPPDTKVIKKPLN